MNGYYKAKIININGSNVTYEYSDENGFVQISSLMPTNITLSVGDIVWITVRNGEVVSVTKRRSVMANPSAVKALGVLMMIVVLLVLWLIWWVLKKAIIMIVWVVVIAAVVLWAAAKLRK